MTIRRVAMAVGAVLVIGAGAFWVATVPRRLDPGAVAAVGPGDAARGERIFWAGGCSSCHARPKSKGEEKLRLGGGVELKTAFGTFVTPNISSDRTDGIGAWSLGDFANAVMRGVGRGGGHLYPALPYTSYARMKLSDVADLYAFMKTLPAVKGRPPASRLSFPFDIRRGIGLWNLFYLSPGPVVAFPAGTPPSVLAGRYLVEGPGHCGECHTPRDWIGGTRKKSWLSGAVAAEGSGTVPNITSGPGGIGDWSQKDIASYLQTGFTPDYDTVGGAMVEVQENIARLTDKDRSDIAAYLKAIPKHPNGYPKTGSNG